MTLADNGAPDLEKIRNAAEHGDATAQCILGEGMLIGRPPGLPQDKAAGLDWLQTGARNGNAVCQAELGAIYHLGLFGVPQDDKEAYRWFRLAAEQCHPAAENNIGKMYRDGVVVRQDYAVAAAWFLKSARKGYADGQLNLGDAYLEGKGVKKDYSSEMQWYLKCAEQRSPGISSVCSVALGYMYESGLGVQRDPVNAEMWYIVASTVGDANREILQKQLTFEQIERARKMAEAWKDTHSAR